MNFAEALKVLLNELDTSHSDYTRLKMVNGSGLEVWFSNVSVDTNEHIPHLMYKLGNNDSCFWTPTPMDILATDWSVREQ